MRVLLLCVCVVGCGNSTTAPGDAGLHQQDRHLLVFDSATDLAPTADAPDDTSSATDTSADVDPPQTDAFIQHDAVTPIDTAICAPQPCCYEGLICDWDAQCLACWQCWVSGSENCSLPVACNTNAAWLAWGACFIAHL